MKHIRIAANTPQLPTGSTLQHIGTSYQVSTSQDFTLTDKYLLNVVNDNQNLLEYRAEINITDDDVIYVRYKLHFTDGVESNWSRLVSIKGNQLDMVYTNVVVATPTVTVEKEYLSSENYRVKVTTSAMKLYAGSGTHASTTWVVSDSDGELVYERKNDIDNLTELVLDSAIFDNNKFYEVKVSHIVTTGIESNQGKAIYSGRISHHKLYEIAELGSLTQDRMLYFKLTLFTTLFKSIDIAIRDNAGATVISNLDQKTTTPAIMVKGLNTYTRYSVYARINLNNGTSLPYNLVFSGIPEENYLVPPHPYITYLSKFDYSQLLVLGGQTIQSTSEFYNGTVLMANHNERSVFRYKVKSDILRLVGKALTLPSDDVIGLPHYNILPLHDGNVIINYCREIDGREGAYNVFAMYKHNPVANKFKFINTITRDNELGGTALTSSAVVTRDNNVYYIPNSEVDANGNNIDVSLYKLNTKTFTITKVASLPFSAMFHVSLAITQDNRLVIFGGTDMNGISITDSGKVYRRTNNDVYVYNPASLLFSNIGTLPSEVDDDIYAFQSYLRRDGNIVGFNASIGGSEEGNQNTLIIDPIKQKITYEHNDRADKLVYRSTAVLRTGDILRISGNEVDPQVVYRYVSNTMPESQLDDNTVIVSPITELVVDIGKVVTVDDLYRYEKITINGTNYEDSGTLRYVTKNKVREFKYTDLIITRNTMMSESIFNSYGYRSIYILNNATFVINH